MTDTQTTIEQMNIEIGMFDKGYERFQKLPGVIMTNEEWCNYLAEYGHFKYHSDWNQLMPVIEKIEELEYEELGHHITHVDIHAYMCVIMYNKGNVEIMRKQQYHKDIHRPYGQAKIEMVFNSVYDFIIWYNSTTNTVKL